jgi:hypothetical protein
MLAGLERGQRCRYVVNRRPEDTPDALSAGRREDELKNEAEIAVELNGDA